jgi:hypothetical protein
VPKGARRPGDAKSLFQCFWSVLTVFRVFAPGVGSRSGALGGPVWAGRWGRENEVKKNGNEKKGAILKMGMERWDPEAHFGSHTW